MSSWAQRVHRRAADLGSVVTSCGHPGPGPYPYRLEKVKFGVPLNEVCKNDIPGPLLVLILKLNKEAPQRKDVFRAPGNQSAMKKLIHFLQAGRLVNVDNFSVYTIASVLKKFLRKIPNGIFGRNGEDELFAIVDIDNDTEQQERIHRLITSLPIYTQRLLVLLFGTFRVIASNADRAGTGMTSEALGVSVAPSFFQSCVSDGKTARMEDVLRYKVATKIMKKMIDQFATFNLFGRDNYEFYARVTGRILKVEDEWICSFRFPPPPRGQLAQQNYALQLSLEAGKTWLQCECERWGLIAQDESQSTPALLTSSSSAIDGNSAISLGIIPELSLLESCARLSVSLEGPGVFSLAQNNGETSTAAVSSTAAATAATTSSTTNQNPNDLTSHQVKLAAAIAAAAAATNTSASTSSDKRSSFGANTTLQTVTTANNNNNNGMKHSSSCSSTRSSKSASAATAGSHHMTMDELRAVNRYAESTKSLSYLPQFNIETSQSPPSSTSPTTTTIRAATTATNTVTATTLCSSSQLNAKLSSLYNNNNNNNSHEYSSPSFQTQTSSTSTSSSLSHHQYDHNPQTLVNNNFNCIAKAPTTTTIDYKNYDNDDNINDYHHNHEKLVEKENSLCVIIDPIEKVHERQTQRMKTRSEWFLESGASSSLELSQYNTEFFGGSHNDIQEHQNQIANANAMYLMLHQAQHPQQYHHHLHPNHIPNWLQQQQQEQQQQQQHLHQHHLGYVQRMDISGDEQDSINTISESESTAHQQGGGSSQQQQQQQQSSMMLLMDTNFPSMSVGNIGLSASAESVQFPVKRPSRRGSNYNRHHPHRSSSRRNKENGKSINSTCSATTAAAGGSAGTGSGGGPGSSTPDVPPVIVRSNSFRQKKSSSTGCCSTNVTSGSHRKARAVSFESSTAPAILLPQVSLTPASSKIPGGAGGSDSIDENYETIILMDTSYETPSVLLTSSAFMDSQSSNRSKFQSNCSHQKTQQQQTTSTTTGITNASSVEKLLTNLITAVPSTSSPPSLHFKPPRV